MKRAIDWWGLKWAGIKNEKIRVKASDDDIVTKMKKWKRKNEKCLFSNTLEFFT